VSHAKRLDNASSIFFFLAFTLSKIEYIPSIVTSSIATLISFGFNLIAYLLWFTSSLIHPDHPGKKEKWYGFAKFREQHQLAAIVGFIACTTSVIALIVSATLHIPASWFFLISNICWSISEYHKLNNPPDYDTGVTYEQQKAYFSYTLMLTLIAFLSALTTTLVFIFPVIAIPLVVTTGLLSLGFGIQAGGYWLDYKYGATQDTAKSSNKESYHLLHDSLGVSIKNVESFSPEPYHQNQLFADYQNQAAQEQIQNPDFCCTSTQ